MGLIDHHQIPRCLPDVRVLSTRELKRTEDDTGLVEGVEVPALNLFIEGFRFKDGKWEEELVRELLPPLLSEIGRTDDQQPPATLGPSLSEQNSGLDSLSETDLVCEDGTPGEGGAKSKQSSFNLVRIEINLSVCERRCEAVDRRRARPLRQFVRKITSVVRSEAHPWQGSSLVLSNNHVALTSGNRVCGGWCSKSIRLGS